MSLVSSFPFTHALEQRLYSFDDSHLWSWRNLWEWSLASPVAYTMLIVFTRYCIVKPETRRECQCCPEQCSRIPLQFRNIFRTTRSSGNANTYARKFGTGELFWHMTTKCLLNLKASMLLLTVVISGRGASQHRTLLRGHVDFECDAGSVRTIIRHHGKFLRDIGGVLCSIY